MSDAYAALEDRPTSDSLFGKVEADSKRASADLAGLAKSKLAEDTRIAREGEHRMEADRTRIQDAYNAEGVGPSQLQPWNAEKEREKFYTSPIDAFGSLASVFAIAASAFTHAPMANALNASAAAMGAIKQNDEKEYERSHEAWKQNMDLAKKRFDMQHTLYSDAIGLMNTDATASRIKLQNAATRFGDQKMLYLLENGMDKEIVDLTTSRYKQMEELNKVQEGFTESNMRKQAFEAADKQFNPQGDPMQRLTIWKEAHGVREPWMDKLVTDYIIRHPDDPEGAAKFVEKLRITGRNTGGGTEAERYVREHIADRIKEHPEESIQDAQDALREHFRKTNQAPITANRREQLQTHVDQFDNANKLIDGVTDVLDRYVGAAGLAGKANRLGERLSNIGGSFQTDRVQMMRDIEELQVMAPRLLLDQSTGRPLSAEAGHIREIIAGLNAGDTTANTLRAMKEIKARFVDMKQKALERLEGKWKPGASESPAAAPSTDWLNAYPVKK